MTQLEAVEVDIVDTEDGYYFKFLGGLSFTKPDAPIVAPGNSRCVVASSKYGLTAFTDLSGDPLSELYIWYIFAPPQIFTSAHVYGDRCVHCKNVRSCQGRRQKGWG